MREVRRGGIGKFSGRQITAALAIARSVCPAPPCCRHRAQCCCVRQSLSSTQQVSVTSEKLTVHFRWAYWRVAMCAGETVSRKFFFSRHKFGFLSSEARNVPKNSVCVGWTVRGPNPGGSEIVRTRPERPLGPPSLLNNGYGDIPGGKAAGVSVDHPHPKAPRL